MADPFAPIAIAAAWRAHTCLLLPKGRSNRSISVAHGRRPRGRRLRRQPSSTPSSTPPVIPRPLCASLCLHAVIFVLLSLSGHFVRPLSSIDPSIRLSILLLPDASAAPALVAVAMPTRLVAVVSSPNPRSRCRPAPRPPLSRAGCRIA